MRHWRARTEDSASVTATPPTTHAVPAWEKALASPTAAPSPIPVRFVRYAFAPRGTPIVPASPAQSAKDTASSGGLRPSTNAATLLACAPHSGAFFPAPASLVSRRFCTYRPAKHRWSVWSRRALVVGDLGVARIPGRVGAPDSMRRVALDTSRGSSTRRQLSCGSPTGCHRPPASRRSPPAIAAYLFRTTAGWW